MTQRRWPNPGELSGPAAPQLSVIIPTRDTRELTLACLQSLVTSDHPDDTEILVVDDASVDGTGDAIRQSFPSVRVLRNWEPAGFTGSVNRGLREISGRVILLLNSDTEVARGSLPALMETFSDPRLGVLGASLFYADGRSQWSGGPEPTLLWLTLLSSGLPGALWRLPLCGRLRELIGRSSPPGLVEVDWVTGAALAVRKEVLSEIGLLDGRYAFYAQDLDLCTRARDAGWRVAVTSEVRVVHHHGSSISRKSPTLKSQQLQTLWTDLLRWAEKRRGRRWARRAWQNMRRGARLRIVFRKAVGTMFHGERRLSWREETTVCRSALVALDRFGKDHLGA